MQKYNQYLGKIGETIALRYLQNNHFEIVEQNYYTRWGEADIIALKNNIIHFVEVKTRTSLNYGRPEEAFTKYKYIKAKRAALIYLREKNLQNKKYQIDVLAIVYNSEKNQAQVRFFSNV